MGKICINAYRSPKHTDEQGRKMIVCQLTKALCIAQRYCTNDNQYVVSENANRYCKNYNK